MPRGTKTVALLYTVPRHLFETSSNRAWRAADLFDAFSGGGKEADSFDTISDGGVQGGGLVWRVLN